MDIELYNQIEQYMENCVKETAHDHVLSLSRLMEIYSRGGIAGELF